MLEVISFKFFVKMFNQYNRIYILGIGGAAMSALARWFLWQGKVVAGYDASKTSTTEKLSSEGIFVQYNCDLNEVPEIFLEKKEDTLILFSPAIGNGTQLSNLLFSYFYDRQYTLVKRSDIFKEITKKYFTIAAAGTHGKTSTTGLLAHLLYNSDKKVVAFIGGNLRQYNTNFLANCSANDDYIVVIEADEYDRFFLSLDYNIAIVTTVDPDHLDYYLTVNDFNNAFRKFVSHKEDKGSIAYVQKNICNSLNLENRNIVQYDISDSNSIHSENISIKSGCFYFDYVDKNYTIPMIKLFTPGRHQIENAIAIVAVCLKLDLSIDLIKRNFADYKGIDRRFNLILEHNGIVLIDDFAHHPIEIASLFTTVKSLYPGKRITVVFQSHTYTRTRDFLSGFVEVLNTVDSVILLDIFPARELDVYNISSKNIFDRLNLKEKLLCHNAKNIVEELKNFEKPEVVLIVGAGNIASLVIEPIKKWILGGEFGV